jgi:glyoxylase-like metal-dependent hydrolase (beta-lactamase superfamily II)
MCETYLREPFTGEHVCEMVRNVFSGRVIFHDGDGEIAPGITVHAMGGHSRGLQSVRVKTDKGYMMLASDASHFYENFLTGKVFPIVVETPRVLTGYERLKQLADTFDLIVPGHDPLVCDLFPKVAGGDAGVYRLDAGPSRPIADLYG